MKSTLSVLMIVAAGIMGANGDAVSCSVIDYLYYSSDCCDGSNSVQCMESIPQTDKAAIDNLAALKRADGAACQSGDGIEYFSGGNFSGLVCKESVSVDCQVEWGNYTACADGSKSRTFTILVPTVGGGAACPDQPETAACTGPIGGSCTANEHCDTGNCDIGVTDKCAADTSMYSLLGSGNGAPQLTLTKEQCQHYSDLIGVTMTELTAGVDGGVDGCSVNAALTSVNFNDGTNPASAGASSADCSDAHKCVECKAGETCAPVAP